MWNTMKASLLLFLGAYAVSASTVSYRRSDNGTRDWDAAAQLAENLVSQLTLDEKVQMITGNSSAGYCIGNITPIPRLNFTGLCMLDGPNAVNRADLASVFPSGITAAATWDRELIYRRGYALGEEFKGKGGHVALGPTTGPMGRHALGGRNWEGFGPDPYLAGISITESINGLQDAGVQACAKHYIANEQETQRSSTINPDGTQTEAISSNVDDRTIHELYLWPFANAIKAGSSSIMCSYNRVNKEYACQNSYILQEILRDELGFKGYVVSDWFATHSTAKSINSGLDLEMPGHLPVDYPGSQMWFGENVLNAIRNGSVTEARVDDMIRNILTPYYYLGQDAKDYPNPDDAFAYVLLIQEASIEMGQQLGLIPDGFVFPRGRDVRGDHAKIIREMGAAGTVLLKNVNDTLPLKTPKVIGVFGNDAGDFTNGFFRPSEAPESVNTGTMIIGGGSGTGRASYVVSPLDAIKTKARETDAEVVYVTHNEVLANNDFRGVYPPPELCLVFQQTFASESFDRTSFELDGNSTAVINNVADYCGNTIVVTHSGGVNTMPWANNTKIGAILAAHYPGQESGNSIVDVLWGDMAPSGRLPYTVPRSAKDAGPAIVNLTQPVDDPLAWQSDFSEGQLIDYRHYDAQGIEPLYEFGFGLTYTTFAIDEHGTSVALAAGSVAERPDATSPVQPGGYPELWEDVVVVKTSVSNTGNRTAHAVPQLYLSFPDSAPEGTPVKVLRGFEKVLVEAGASADVEFRLQRRDVSYWDTDDKAWVIPSGEFVFLVGFSSRDLPVEKAFSVLASSGSLEGVDSRVDNLTSFFINRAISTKHRGPSSKPLTVKPPSQHQSATSTQAAFQRQTILQLISKVCGSKVSTNVLGTSKSSQLSHQPKESAAANLSVLDIQRFTAEITLTQPNADSNGWPRPLLCFTPHADFINDTSGHRGLLRACRESRQAAQKQIHCLLPIHYLTTDATGSLVIRQASVPFDPSGHFCISGLGEAILDASEGRGARGSKLLDSHSAEYIISQIQDLEQATSPIKNLTIVLGRALNNFPSRKYMLGWDDKVFDLIASRMPNLKTASLTSEGVLDRRHHLDQQEFNKMHPSVAVFPVGERWWEQRAVPWYTLWANWRYERDIFIYIAHIKIIEMKRRQSAKPFVPGLVDSAADAAKERQLELSLSAVSE